MKIILVTACLLLILAGCNLQAPAQMVTWSPDSAVRSDPNFGMERYHEVLRYHDPLMYLVFPVVKPIVERKVALEDGEGKDGFWLEGHLGYRFSIFKGQFYSPRFIQRTRLTLDVTLHSMLTRDESSPILPFNTKVGPGLDFLLSSLDKLKQDKSGLCWTSLQFHHYSNGQADTFFLESPFKRNNYKSGNFSTNYWRFLLHAAINKKKFFDWIIGLPARSGYWRSPGQQYGTEKLLWRWQDPVSTELDQKTQPRYKTLCKQEQPGW
jgi:hypothetical protein